MAELVGYLPFVLALGVTGVVAGLIAGLFGVGGGIVMVPVLASVLVLTGFDAAIIMHVAVATSLATIIPTGYRSARAHASRGAVDGQVLRLWGLPIVAASLLGGLMAGLFSGAALRIIFGVFALAIAINTLVPVHKKLAKRPDPSANIHRVLAAVIGYVSALMGIGGGSLSVPTLVIFGRPMHTAVGTGSALGVMLATPGAIGFVISGWAVAGRPPFSFGFVNLPAFLVLAIVASAVSPVGAALAHRLEEKWLRVGFAIFLGFVGARMLWQVVAG
jgi:uncharacterized protein